MKRIFKIMMAVALIVIAGCSKYDDSALWNEVKSQADRLAALEAWQQTVNSNITALQGLVSALQNNRTITDVSPFSTPAPGGYNIAFNTGSPITIYHGTNGTNGTNGTDGTDGTDGTTPQIGVAEYPASSGKYYWTLNGEFIMVNEQRVPATGTDGQDGQDGQDGTNGQNGITPQLRINSITNFWEISYDNGVTWTSLDVKATGDDGQDGATGTQGPAGPAGPQGDAIFAPNGVNYSNPDYVVFTLADGVTTITLPRYKEMSLTLTGTFNNMYPGNTQHVTFTTTGEVETVRMTDVPANWKVQIDYNKQAGTGTFHITSPSVRQLVTENTYGEPLLLLVDEDGKATVLTGMLQLSLDPPAYAADNRIWIIRNETATNIFSSVGIRQMWSAPIEMPDCNKTDYNGGVIGNATALPDGRREEGIEGYFYSWEYVTQQQAEMCPSGWRVPDIADYQNLEIALGGSGASGALPVPTGFALIDEWNAVRNGNFITGSPYLQLTTNCMFWCAYQTDAQFSDYVNYDLNGYTVTYGGTDRTFAMQVRCVRDIPN